MKPLKEEAQIQYQAISCGTSLDKVALGHVYPLVLLFPLVSDPRPCFIHLPPTLYNNLGN